MHSNIMGNTLEKKHISVMLDESLDHLNLSAGSFIIDGTLGEAGHSLEILQRIGDDGLLISLDHDQNAIDFVSNSYEKLLGENWKLARLNFANIAEAVTGLERKPNGILLDLGMSSRHIDADDRGFSYKAMEQPLDMRMDSRLGVTAKDLITVLNERQLTQVLREFGEERNARRIAVAIKSSTKPIETVGDLVEIVNRAMPAASKFQQKHPEMRVFQALRIAVNTELDNLSQGLSEGFEILDRGGRFVVISFHSLEDRIVKQSFNKLVKEGKALDISKGMLLPTQMEIDQNPRSRSAKLRAIEKL